MPGAHISVKAARFLRCALVQLRARGRGRGPAPLLTEPLTPHPASSGIEAANGAGSPSERNLAMTTETTNRPTHRVYAVTKRPGQEKANWTQIGAAWAHKDGKGLGLKLDLVPVSDAEIVLRELRAEDDNN